MVEYCALASGSKGNCFYIGNENEAVLIDAGISRKQTLLRVTQMGLSIEKIKAIFITHEHIDHCQGARVLQKVLDIPIFLTQGTYNGMSTKHHMASPSIISDTEEIKIGDLTIKAFSKKHDGLEPCSFTVKSNDTTIGVFTDIGEVCTQVQENLHKCDALFLESNYDSESLDNGPYPIYIINRIKSSHGHLSNDQARELIEQRENIKLQHLILSHISENNNSIEHVKTAFSELREELKIDISIHEKPTSVFSL